MNTEQAIKVTTNTSCIMAAETFLKNSHPQDGSEPNEAWNVVCYLLKYTKWLLEQYDTVLRAQQERENPKPCEYCGQYVNKYLYVSDATDPRTFFDVTGGNLRFFNEQFEGGYCDMFKIDYCPMCGRKLEPKEAR